MDQPTAEQALRQLEPLVGEWTLEAKWPDGKPWPGGGRVTVEWIRQPSLRRCNEANAAAINDIPEPAIAVGAHGSLDVVSSRADRR
jgi:hypothetical protein